MEPATEAPAAREQSRAEKKAVKALSKLGLKPVPTVTRVTIKKQQNVSPNKA